MLLGLPLKIGNRFGDRQVPIRKVVEYDRRLVNETLAELSKLPECVEPDWLDHGTIIPSFRKPFRKS
jgi:hypothetical protein